MYKPRFYDGGFYDCYQKIVATSGITGLWKGFTPCLARAFIANAVSFYTFEITRSYLVERGHLKY
jgi:solute carrier family 25 carnitine/acylcarnitine transporter 20/29